MHGTSPGLAGTLPTELGLLTNLGKDADYSVLRTKRAHLISKFNCGWEGRVEVKVRCMGLFQAKSVTAKASVSQQGAEALMSSQSQRLTSELAALHVAHAFLSGTIPEEISNVSKLEGLVFPNTKGLNGTMPVGLRDLPLLTIILSGNRFTGTIPHWLVDIDGLGECLDAT